MKKERREYKENQLGFIVLLISILICIVSVSYAVWTQIYQGQKENQISTATLTLMITEEKNAINLINAIPVTDATGLSYEPYTFKIKNTGTTDVDYIISMEDDEISYISDQCSQNRLEWTNIRFSFTEKNNTPIMNNLGETVGVLYKGTIPSETTKEYAVKLWIKSDATKEIMGKHFHGKIRLDTALVNKSSDR